MVDRRHDSCQRSSTELSPGSSIKRHAHLHQQQRRHQHVTPGGGSDQIRSSTHRHGVHFQRLSSEEPSMAQQPQRDGTVKKRKGGQQKDEKLSDYYYYPIEEDLIQDDNELDDDDDDDDVVDTEVTETESSIVHQTRGQNDQPIQSTSHNLQSERHLDPSMFFTFQRYTPPTTKSTRQSAQSQPTRFVPGRYVRATHRLYIRPHVDVVDLLQHPDRFVDWDAVVKVDILCHETSDLLMCPICLDSVFTTPRITRCGHVFCFPCIMRTLDEKLRTTQNKPKCPVCGEPLRISHLKPSRFQIFQTPQIGDSVSMCLMTRESLSSIAILGCPKTPGCPKTQLPSHSTQQSSSSVLQPPTELPPPNSTSSPIPPFLISSNPAAYLYRLVSLDPRDPFLEEDLCSLESKRLETLSLEDEESIECIDDCIRYLLLEGVENDSKESAGSKRDKKAHERSNCSSDDTALMSPAECHMLFNYSRFDSNVVIQQLEAASIDASSEEQLCLDDHQQKQSEDLQLLSSSTARDPNISDPMIFCFYQLSDGQLMILDELCQQCLIADVLTKRRRNQPVQVSATVDDGKDVHTTQLENKASSTRIDPTSGQETSRLSEPPLDYDASSDDRGSTQHLTSCSMHDAHLLPPVLKDLPILWVEEEIVDTAFRKRHPYLNFLPRGTTVQFVELDLSSIVSSQTLANFYERFRRRKTKRDSERKRKAKIEDQRAAQIQAMHSAQLQRRLLEQQRSDTGHPIDPVTGLLVQAITTDHSLFPALHDSSSPTVAPQSNPPADVPITCIDVPITCIDVPIPPALDRPWATRINQPRLDLFPSLQESTLSPSSRLPFPSGTTPKHSTILPQHERASLSQQSVRHPPHGQRPKPVPNPQRPKPVPNPQRPSVATRSSDSHQQQQHSSRGAPPWRRRGQPDDEADEEASEYLASNRRLADHHQDEQHSMQWDALDAALLEDSAVDDAAGGSKKGKKKSKKIVLSSSSSYRL